MRILHTSDWHLGDRLGTRDRLDDQFARVGEIAAYIESHAIDLVLIAGDVFEEAPLGRLSEIVDRLALVLRRPLALGVHIVFLAGNHDRSVVFTLLRSSQALAGVDAAHVVFVERPDLLTLTLRNRERVQVVALPYPFPDRYGVDSTRWSDLDDKQRVMAEVVREHLRALASAADPATPTVLTGHLLLTGVRGGHCINEHEEIPVDATLSPAFAYVALGHIHKPQVVDDAGYARYSGSIERMDQAEASETKSVVRVDITAGTPVGVQLLPLHPRAIAAVVGGSRAELEARRAELADPDETLVFVHFQLRADDSFRDLLAAAHELFPYLYRHDVTYTDTMIEPLPDPAFIRPDPRDTVRAYLRDVLAGDPEADEILALAEGVLEPDGPIR